MKQIAQTPDQNRKADGSAVYWLAVVLVVTGLLNVTPAIPGWDELWRYVTGIPNLKVRRFPTEWL